MDLCCKFFLLFYVLGLNEKGTLIYTHRFDSVLSAKRCILKLRERRDLHPSFSKVRFSFPPSYSTPMLIQYSFFLDA